MFSKTEHKKGIAEANADRSAPSIISNNLSIVGSLKTEGEIQIDGTVEGNVTGRALVIGERARVNGEIVADDVVIRGSTEGRIRARRVQLTKTAKVMGDILHESLSIDSGPYVEGQLKRLEKRSEPKINLVRDASDKERILAPLTKAATVD
jgi:cytoskeletal protein CcmA (bactofilin family)